MNNEPPESIEQRIARLEDSLASLHQAVAPMADNLKSFVASCEKSAAAFQSVGKMVREQEKFVGKIGNLLNALGSLADVLVDLESRQQAVIRYLNSLEPSGSPSAKEIFLSNMQRYETISEKLELFVRLIKQSCGIFPNEPPAPS